MSPSLLAEIMLNEFQVNMDPFFSFIIHTKHPVSFCHDLCMNMSTPQQFLKLLDILLVQMRINRNV